jgi:hypothetical protein
MASLTLTAEGILLFFVEISFSLGRLRFNKGHRKNQNAESLEQALREPHIIMRDRVYLTEGAKKL